MMCTNATEILSLLGCNALLFKELIVKDLVICMVMTNIDTAIFSESFEFVFSINGLLSISTSLEEMEFIIRCMVNE